MLDWLDRVLDLGGWVGKGAWSVDGGGLGEFDGEKVNLLRDIFVSFGYIVLCLILIV